MIQKENVERSERHSGEKFSYGTTWGRCPSCGREVLLPCLACRMKILRSFNRAGREAAVETPEDLGIDLKHEGERLRYEEVRRYRDKYGKPMFGNDASQENRNQPVSQQDGVR